MFLVDGCTKRKSNCGNVDVVEEQKKEDKRSWEVLGFIY